MKPCNHVTEGLGVCGEPETRMYLPGWRCPDHTPAKLAGHLEPGQTATHPIGWLPPSPQSESRVHDRNAIRSGKRRSSIEAYRDAQRG